MFGRPSGQKIRKEDVPAATQLFTPDWIVRYMVENSLGRIAIHNLKYGDWLEAEKKKIDVFKSKWKYYLEEAEQSQEIVDRFRIEESHKYNKGDVPPYVDSTFLDPCMGSGHILVYAFDVFMDIYTAQGYTERDAAQRIVEKNLYGLELDDRATQLAYFAVMMKARSYDRRFFTRGIRPNLCSIQESNSLNTDYLELFGDLKPTAQKLVNEYIDAKEYGSILNLSITANEIAQLENKYAEIDGTIYDNIFDTIRQAGLRTIFAPLIKQAKITVKRYDVVCTNPPYMGGGMSLKLYTLIAREYEYAKSDLFSVFIVRCLHFLNDDGLMSLITPESWMFLSTYNRLRTSIYKGHTIVNLLQFGVGAFDSGFGTAAFTINKKHYDNYYGLYSDLRSYEKKERWFQNKNYLRVSSSLFDKLTDNVIAYWCSPKLAEVFSFDKLGDHFELESGIVTGNNQRFLRLWYEVSSNTTALQEASPVDLCDGKIKWFKCNKGGGYRKWYGNLDHVVNLGNNAAEIKRDVDASIYRLRKADNYFLFGFNWPLIGLNKFSAKTTPYDVINNKAANSIHIRGDINYELLGYMNCCVYNSLLNMINPTVNYPLINIYNSPYFPITDSRIRELVVDNINNSKLDWDSFEISWDFKEHPFVWLSKGLWDCTNVAASLHYFYGGQPEPGCPIETCWLLWQGECNERFNQLKANEEELNRIFIDIYGLQDELTPEVEDKDVTVRRADLQRDIRSLISYAVGCMFGRYSLDREGLVFAGGNFEKTYWKFKGLAALDENGYMIHGGYPGVSMWSEHYRRLRDSDDWESATQLTFEPDLDNCIPITDTPYFEDDIVGRFVEFVKVVYGEDTLEANLEFIAKALGNKGNTSRDIIRNYFLNDFFKDHCKIYQKCPIYWLFDSGKQNGFKALVYMHRWNADTIGNMRVEYLHRIQRTYEKEIEREQDTIDNTTNNRDRASAEKRKEKLQKQLKEAKDYDAKVAHLALSRPDIDLDDGVKVNYEKVQTAPDGKKLQILAKI